MCISKVDTIYIESDMENVTIRDIALYTHDGNCIPSNTDSSTIDATSHNSVSDTSSSFSRSLASDYPACNVHATLTERPLPLNPDVERRVRHLADSIEFIAPL